MPERVRFSPSEIRKERRRAEERIDPNKDDYASLDRLSQNNFERIPGTPYLFQKDIGFGFDKNGMLTDVLARRSEIETYSRTNPERYTYRVGDIIEDSAENLYYRGFRRIGTDASHENETFYLNEAPVSGEVPLLGISEQGEITSAINVTGPGWYLKTFSQPNTKIAIEERKLWDGSGSNVIDVSLKNDLVELNYLMTPLRTNYLNKGERELRTSVHVQLQNATFLKPLDERLINDDLHKAERRKNSRPGYMNIGIPNDTERLRDLRSINSLSIEHLEKVMRPGASSASGFLARDENLVDVLSRDNDTVKEYGITHQDIAKMLELLMHASYLTVNNYSSHDAKQNKYVRASVTFHDQELLVSNICFSGYQESPFGDGDTGSCDIIVTNKKTNQELQFSKLLVGMIRKYGFYEGSVPHRLDPETLMKFLGIEKKP